MISRAAFSFSISDVPMPETAKILQFRTRQSAPMRSRAQVLEDVSAYLAIPAAERSDRLTESMLTDGDSLSAICTILWDTINVDPAMVDDEAPRLYRQLFARPAGELFFDERDYFLGEFALLAGGSSRHLGRREDSEAWFDRADASFRHTVAPASHLARVSYNRLALRYDMRRFSDVIELLPSTALTFEKLGMRLEVAKCGFLQALSHKELGEFEEAANRLQLLSQDREMEAGLRGSVLMNLGDVQTTRGNLQEAVLAYQEAQPALMQAKRLAALADLKAIFGSTLLAMGRRSDAIQAFREAVDDHIALGMVTRAAYLRLVLASALLAVGNAREAEWQIQAALPTIDDQKMVPEGYAAVALLRESVRQRKTDPKALLELRNYLQTRN
jgi:tetratricopeptide (TPR) repeat protein